MPKETLITTQEKMRLAIQLILNRHWNHAADNDSHF